MLSYLKKIDIGLLFPVIFLSLASLVVIWSVKPAYFSQQLISILIGFTIAFAIAMIDIRPFLRHRFVVAGIYFLAIALLIFTVLFATPIRGTRSWIVIGPTQFQTSEFAKVALIIIFSYFFAKRHIGIAHLSNILIPAAYFALPAAFVLSQPDMGTALILGGLFVGYLFVSGIRPRHIIIGIILGAAALLWSWNGFLADYQKERILGLFYPERDPLGVNYSVIQSKIAIGSGGFWGKGFKQGTQSQLGFLPEAHNDFIFSSLVEEWGLFGGILALGAFLFLLFKISSIGMQAQNNFSKFLCLGAVIVLLLHFILNVGSAMGILPVIGVPFPFLSYGGSNLLVNFILIGMIQSIALRTSF